MKIALISCVSKKQELSDGEKIKAKDLYISPLFKMAYDYAKKLDVDRVFILSAKHGLLSPDKEIGYYNETLLNKSTKECKDWAEDVLQSLKREKVDLSKDTFYLLAGKKYYQYLLGEGKIENYRLPYDGLKGIGYILNFLKSQL